jgi:hypothetical protein
LPEEKFNPVAVFASRLTEMLEHLDNSTSRDLLKDLAKGPPTAVLTQEAGASLKRLRAKSIQP